MAYTTAQVFNLSVNDDLFKLTGFQPLRSEKLFTTVDGYSMHVELVRERGRYVVVSVLTKKGQDPRYKELNASDKPSYAYGRYHEYIYEAAKTQRGLLSTLP